jgi:hypothetical protein
MPRWLSLPWQRFWRSSYSPRRFASGAGILALMSMVPTVLVLGFGMEPLVTVFILLAWSGVTMVAAVSSGYLPDMVSSRQRDYLLDLRLRCGAVAPSRLT